MKSQIREIGCLNKRITLEFARHPDSNAAEARVKFQSDQTVLIQIWRVRNFGNNKARIACILFGMWCIHSVMHQLIDWYDFKLTAIVIRRHVPINRYQHVLIIFRHVYPGYINHFIILSKVLRQQFSFLMNYAASVRPWRLFPGSCKLICVWHLNTS